MNNPVELTVVIKGSDSTYRQKFLVYETVTMAYDCPRIAECVKEAKESYRGDIDDVLIRASMTL
jgi:hypothetical protein